VAGRLRELGAFVVDADEVAREVVLPGTPALAEIAEHFGAGIIAVDGTLRRQELARVVFNDPAELRVLNRIMHQRMAQRTDSLFEQARAAGAAVLVHDMALLVEGNLMADYDLVVVVSAPVELRLERLAGRGIARQDALARMAAQATDSQRGAVADFLIDNSGDRAATMVQVDRLWEKLQQGLPRP
jgi:dephospho-CoA kinase